MDEVTPNEIAKALGVTGLTFRNWLRARKAAGHPILAGHEYRSRYRFTRAEADQLIGEYRAGDGGAPLGAPDARSGAAAAADTLAAPDPRATPRRTGSHGDAASARQAALLPQPPVSFDHSALRRAGFVGWTTWRQLQRSGYAAISATPGTYLVHRPVGDPPTFVHPSPAGWFKGNDPSVSEARLQAEWVYGANVVYIGKADVLRRRLGSSAASAPASPSGTAAAD